MYFDIIRKKTATLIAACCASGANSVGQNKEIVEKMRLFGEKAGIAFQIKDDLFDLLGTEHDTGKDSGGDVKKNMRTLPIIYSYDNMEMRERRRLKTLLSTKRKTTKIMKELKGMIEVSGGFEYARRRLDEFSNNALEAISNYPESPIKRSLSDMVAFNVARVR